MTNIPQNSSYNTNPGVDLSKYKNLVDLSKYTKVNFNTPKKRTFYSETFSPTPSYKLKDLQNLPLPETKGLIPDTKEYEAAKKLLTYRKLNQLSTERENPDLFAKVNQILPDTTPDNSLGISPENILIESGYGVFQKPQGYSYGGNKLSWGTPEKPVIKTMTMLDSEGKKVTGQFVQDLDNKTKLIKTVRGDYDPVYSKSFRGKTPGFMGVIDHTMPLLLGGADNVANRELLNPKDNYRKTKSNAIPYTLYAYGDISLGKARVMALQWRNPDVSDVPIPNKFGLVSDIKNGKTGIEIAREAAKHWYDAKPVTLKKTMAELPKVAAHLGDYRPFVEKGYLPKSILPYTDTLANFAKGFESAGTFGFVPYEPQDTSLSTKIAGTLGIFAGSLATFSLTKGLLSFGLKAPKSIYGAIKGTNLLKKAKNAEEIANTEKTIVKNKKVAEETIKTFNKTKVPTGLVKFASSPDRLKNIAMTAGITAMLGQENRFIKNKFNPYVLSGEQESKKQQSVIKNVLGDLFYGSVIGGASPTLKGTAYATLAPLTMSYLGNPDDPTQALIDGAVYGTMHGLAARKAPGYNNIALFGGKKTTIDPFSKAYNAAAEKASYELLRNYDNTLPELGKKESVPTQFKDEQRIKQSLDIAIDKIYKFLFFGEEHPTIKSSKDLKNIYTGLNTKMDSLKNRKAKGLEKISLKARKKISAKNKATKKYVSEEYGKDFGERGPKDMTLKAAMAEIKRLTVAARQLYKGSLPDALRQQADLDDLLSFGRKYFNKRFSQQEAFINPPRNQDIVNLFNDDFLQKSFNNENPNPNSTDLNTTMGFTGYAATKGNITRAQNFMKRVKAGTAAKIIVVGKRPDLESILNIKNKMITDEDIKSGKHAIDPAPDKALQGYGITFDRDPEGKIVNKQLVEIGWGTTEHRRETGKYAFNKNEFIREGKVPPLKSNNVDVFDNMSKHGLDYIIMNIDPMSEISTKEGYPFIVGNMRDSNWEKSIEVKNALKNVKDTNPVSMDVAKYKKTTDLKEKANLTHNIKSKGETASDIIPKKNALADSSEERKHAVAMQNLTHDSILVMQKTLKVSSPEEIKKMFKEEFGMIIDDNTAKDIFDKREAIELRDFINLLTKAKEVNNLDAITQVRLNLMKKHLKSGLVSNLALDMPIIGKSKIKDTNNENNIKPIDPRTGKETSTIPTTKEIIKTIVQGEPSIAQKPKPKNVKWRDFSLTNSNKEGINSGANNYILNKKALDDFTRKKMTELAKKVSNDGENIAGNWSTFFNTIIDKIKEINKDPNFEIKNKKEIRDMHWLYDHMANSSHRRELSDSGLVEGSLENIGETDKKIEAYNKEHDLPKDNMEIVSIANKRNYVNEKGQPIFDSRDKFTEDRRKLLEYVPIGITAKGVTSVNYIKIDHDLAKKVDIIPEKYLNEGEKIDNHEDKFIRAFIVDILGLPKTTSSADLVKRSNLLFNRYDPYIGTDASSSIKIHILKTKKIAEYPELYNTEKNSFLVPNDPADESALNSFKEGSVIDGKIILGEKLYEKLIKAFNYDPYKFRTGFKPLISGDVFVDGKLTKMVQKGHAIKVDPALRNMLQENYGFNINDTDIVSFDTNAKFGPKEGTYEIPLSSIYSKPLNVGKEGRITLSFESKFPADDNNVKEDMIKQTAERKKDFEKFNDEIMVSRTKEDLEKTIDAFSEKYNIDKDSLFFGTSGESFNLGAAKISLANNLEKISKNIFLETVLTSQAKGTGRAFISPPIKLKIDGPDKPARFVKDDEIILGSQFMKDKGLSESDEVVILRDPAYDINNFVVAKVINGDKLGHTSLGKEHAVVSSFNERMKLGGDQDGDTMFIMKKGKNGIPESYFESIRKNGSKIIPFTEVIPRKSSYVTRENIKDVINSQLVGDDQTSKIAMTSRAVPVLKSNKLVVRIYAYDGERGPRGNKVSKYELLSNGQPVEHGLTSASTFSFDAIPEWNYLEKKLRNQSLQEAVDSKKSDDIMLRTNDNDPNWMLEQVFVNHDGSKIDKKQSWAINGALKNIQKNFNIKNIIDNSRTMTDAMKELEPALMLSKKIEEAGGELTPYQAKLLSLSNVERLNIPNDIIVSSDKIAGKSLRKVFDMKKVQTDPMLNKLRKMTIDVKSKYYDKRNKDYRNRNLFKKMSNFIDKHKKELTQENLKDISLWAAVSNEANLAQSPKYKNSKFVWRMNDLINAYPEIAKKYYSTVNSSEDILANFKKYNLSKFTNPTLSQTAPDNTSKNNPIVPLDTNGEGGPGYNGREGPIWDRFKNIVGKAKNTIFSPFKKIKNEWERFNAPHTITIHPDTLVNKVNSKPKTEPSYTPKTNISVKYPKLVSKVNAAKVYNPVPNTTNSTKLPPYTTHAQLFDNYWTKAKTRAKEYQNSQEVKNNLLEAIGKAEQNKDYKNSYSKYHSGNKILRDYTIPQSTVADLANRYGTTALGNWQIQSPTAIDVLKNKGIDPNTFVFDKEGQAKIAGWLLERRMRRDLANNEKLTPENLIHELSQEWASLPKDPSNNSYYSNGNKSFMDYNKLYELAKEFLTYYKRD